jgi:hypothetical protein
VHHGQQQDEQQHEHPHDHPHAGAAGDRPVAGARCGCGAHIGGVPGARTPFSVSAGQTARTA